MDATVIIPTRNKPAELRRCIGAVLGQRFDGHFEVLVCDDGSTDGTRRMVEEWAARDSRLFYLHQPQRGPASARNLGIRNARGRLIAMTDDDTIPQEGWLQGLCFAAAEHGVSGVEGRVTHSLHAREQLGPCEAAPSNEAGGVYLTANVLYRGEVLAATGGFDEQFPFAAFEDCDLAARVKQHGAIAWAQRAVVLHPARPVTWRSTLQRLRHWPWAMVVARRYGYLGWPRYSTRHPRLRVLWNAVVKLPAGRFVAALRAIRAHPRQALRAAAWALAEPFAALCIAVPKILRLDLDSAALVMDYLNLVPPSARVGLVAVNYKQPQDLVQCVASFQKSDYPDLKIIVVESEADEHAAEQLHAQLPGVEWLASKENLGYTGGNNLGISRALELGCEYILLVNADTECIAPDFIARLVRFFELNPGVGLAGPRVYLRQPGRRQNTVLRYPAVLRQIVDWFGFRLFARLYERSGNRVRRAEMLNGVCVMLCATAIRQVGGFDPRFFMYIEDADLGLRLRAAGWDVVYVPVDSIIHHQKESGYEMESRASLLLRRNSVYFLHKHHHRVQAWILAGANLALAVARALFSASGEKFRRRMRFVRSLFQEFRSVLAPSAPVEAHGQTALPSIEIDSRAQ